MTLRWTIYCHIHTDSGRRYIGLTKLTMMKRWNQHVANANRKTGKGCLHFWNAIRKYGKNTFSHQILEVCSSIEEANEAEQAWIESFTATNPDFGFNLMRGGYKWVGLTRDSKAESSSRAKKLWQDPDYRIRVSTAVSKSNKSPERIAALISRNKSMTLSSDARHRIIQSNINRVCTEETRKRLSKIGTGRKMSSEVIMKTSAAHHLLPKKTHCKHGHSLQDAWLRSNGERLCRICSKLRKISQRLKKAA
jgi:group I intron endonuclease